MPNDRDENEILRNKMSRANRVVVKVSSTLLHKEAETFNRVIKDVYELRRAGKTVVVVSSGAIHLGMQRAQVKERPKVIPELQALACIGQPVLMRKWQDAAQQLPIAQLLLTHEELADRRSSMNIQHTLKVLTEMGVLPIVNENDAAAIDEIKSGDDDHLAALVAVLWEAEVLVMLSEIDGLFDADPNLNPHAERVPLITDLEKAKKRAATTQRPGIATLSSSMATKLSAVEIAHAHSIPVVLTTGLYAGQLSAAIRGDDVGTLFWPQSEQVFDRKNWLTHDLKVKGKLTVDESAKAALIRGKRSLLPAGVRKIEGRFEMGDAVDILGPNGDLVARGLASYDSREASLIMGKNPQQMIEILGYRLTDEMVHRHDLVVFTSTKETKKKH